MVSTPVVRVGGLARGPEGIHAAEKLCQCLPTSSRVRCAGVLSSRRKSGFMALICEREGEPSTRIIFSIWSELLVPRKMGRFMSSSAMTQPPDQTSSGKGVQTVRGGADAGRLSHGQRRWFSHSTPRHTTPRTNGVRVEGCADAQLWCAVVARANVGHVLLVCLEHLGAGGARGAGGMHISTSSRPWAGRDRGALLMFRTSQSRRA